jgi:hypothetical protein
MNVHLPSVFQSKSLSTIRYQIQTIKEPMLRYKLTTICVFSSQEALKRPTLEDDICSNLLNSGTRGALVPDDITLKTEMQGYKLHSHTSLSVNDMNWNNRSTARCITNKLGSNVAGLVRHNI